MGEKTELPLIDFMFSIRMRVQISTSTLHFFSDSDLKDAQRL